VTRCYNVPLAGKRHTLAAACSSDREARSGHIHQLTQATIPPLAASLVSFGLWSTDRINPVYDASVFAFEEFPARDSLR